MPDLIFSGKYFVQEEIAKGGMGVIYKALDRTLNRLVAIKVVHEHFSGDSSFTERFIREARAMARLQHENIVTIFSVEEDRGAYFIVMEYFPGMDLRTKIKARKALSIHESVDIALQITHALAFAHSQGIVHRDIKPANILVDARGRVKLTDFGIAAALDEASITSTGQIIGTPEYMSPEQARGMEVDGRTDLYSLGIVLHEMVVGHTPFHNIPKTGILSKLLDPQFDIALAFSADIPSSIRAIAEDLVRRDPEYRTPRAAILFSQLKECLADLPPRVAEDAATVITTRPTPTIRTTRSGSPTLPDESRTVPFRQDSSSNTDTKPQQPVIPPQHSLSMRASEDEATDIVPPSKAVMPSPSLTPTKSHGRPAYLAPMAVGSLGILLILGSLGLYLSRTEWSAISPSSKTAPPNASADASIRAETDSKLAGEKSPSDLQARIETEQQQLIVDEARVAAKRREAEALQKKEKEEAAKQAKAAEEQRKQAEEAARVARARQEAEQRKFTAEQKRLEREKELATTQARAAEEQRRKAQEELRAAREREEREARRSKEEAEMTRLQAERQRLEKEREAAEEQARLAELQRKKAEEEARLAQERHETEQRRLQAEQQRIEKENELAAQRAKAQEEEHRKAVEEARLSRERLEAEQHRLQVERDRLEKEKELAEHKARVEAEERRKAEAAARVLQERNEAERKRLQVERERAEKEKEVAEQRAKAEAEERRKADEQAREVRQRYEAEQKRLQAEREREERDKEIAAQRAKAEAEERRKADEEIRAARERTETEQRRLQAERERMEKDKREAAEQARAEEEARKKQAAQEEEQRKKDQLLAKLRPGGQMSATSSQRQLRDLIEEFKRAYEGQDLAALERLSEMGSDRLSFLNTMFSNYRTIKVSVQNLNVKDQEASATIIHDVLVNKDGDMVMPSPILRSTRIKIRKTGDEWTKVVW